ncbi:MAG: ferrous iron transporter B [Proteobacteria bacterium]|nr:ferrous iron transporter B [Pseudomonadota bacterium]
MVDRIRTSMSAIVITGNMNVGKTTLFSRISSNDSKHITIPGNSVLLHTAIIKGTELSAIDAPGVFSIFSSNEDEKTARNILIPGTTGYHVKGIILVMDAKTIKRSLTTAIQLSEYEIPMIFAINMIDEASSLGIEIEIAKLKDIFGVDIFPTNLRESIGVKKILTAIPNIKKPKKLIEYPEWIEKSLNHFDTLLNDNELSSRITGILFLTGDTEIERYILEKYGAGMLSRLKNITEQYRKEDTTSSGILLTNIYHRKAEQLTEQIQTIETPSKSPFMARLGDWCSKPVTGIPIALFVVAIMYLFIGSFGATYLVDIINEKFFKGFLIPFITKLIAPLPSDFLKDMIINPDFGILPTGVFLALGLVLPVLFCFYLIFGALEDSGYLSRLSILLDKVFRKMGLNGKGVIPLVMGFSCVTMAILTTRVLDTKKEKNIATFLLLLGMPCAPLLAVMFIILGKMPVSASLTVFGLIFTQIVVAGMLANKILPGSRSPLLMVIPTMRIPKASYLLKNAILKTYFFMKEAVPVFVAASFAVFLFERMGGLDALERIAAPVIKGFMGLPEKSVQVFIKTIIRRESGATEIEHLHGIYDNVQLVVNLLVMTFLSPCMNATIVLFKERGTKTASAIIVIVMFYAVMMGSLVNYTCRFLGVTFM